MTDIERVGMTRDQFEEAESTIERGLETFVEVGQALIGIREGRGYRHGGFATFDEYCQKRWSLSRPHAYHMMDAAQVVATLSPIGDIPAPANESQARALAPLLRERPEAIPAVWKEAVETAPDGRVTAAHVQSVVDRHTEPAPEPHRFTGVIKDAGYEQSLFEPKAIDLASRGFDPASLPSPRLSRAEYALHAIPDLGQWIHIDPSAVADAYRENRPDFKAESFEAIATWVNAVARELRARAKQPFKLVKDAS